jgi:hypothetical protein
VTHNFSSVLGQFEVSPTEQFAASKAKMNVGLEVSVNLK